VPPGGAAFKLSSNGEPLPAHCPAVLEVIAAAAADANRYPDLAASALVEALSGYLGCRATTALGTGSVGGASNCCRPPSGRRRVLYAWRSFEAYPILVQVVGGTSVRPAAARHDLPAMDPASPTGPAGSCCAARTPDRSAIAGAELGTFLRRGARRLLVVLDEAIGVRHDPDVPPTAGAVRGRGNVAVLRHLLQAYGSGLRVGYVVAPPGSGRGPRGPAHAVGCPPSHRPRAVASLAAEDELLDRVAALVLERSRSWRPACGGWIRPTPRATRLAAVGGGDDGVAAACEAAACMVARLLWRGAGSASGAPPSVDAALLESPLGFAHSAA